MPGALLSFGDGHFAMGDGEIIGTAIEGAMNVELTVDLIKKRATPWPRIENAEWMMSVGAARPLEDAARIAFKDMVAWVREKTGLAEMDAYEFVSQAAKAPDRRDGGPAVHGPRQDRETPAAIGRALTRRSGGMMKRIALALALPVLLLSLAAAPGPSELERSVAAMVKIGLARASPCFSPDGKRDRVRLEPRRVPQSGRWTAPAAVRELVTSFDDPVGCRVVVAGRRVARVHARARRRDERAGLPRASPTARV